MLTYVEYINRFWNANIEDFIGTPQGMVYFYLLSVNNSLGWKKTFTQSDRQIATKLKISVNTVQRAKKNLSKMGLIKYIISHKKNTGVNGLTSYSFDIKSRASDTASDTANDTVNDTVLNAGSNTVLNAGSDTQRETLNRYRIDIDKEYIKKEDKSSKKAKSKKSIKNSENETPKKLSAEKKIFIKPTVDEIQEFLEGSGGPPIDAEYFFNYYEANGWMAGKVKMKDWRATVRNWQKRDFTTQPKVTKRLNHPMTNYSGQNTNADDRF